jgi:hypothetical protein
LGSDTISLDNNPWHFYVEKNERKDYHKVIIRRI